MAGASLGNTLQALIFGSLHVLIVLRLAHDVPLWQAFGLLVSLGGGGLGVVDEVKANGASFRLGLRMGRSFW